MVVSVSMCCMSVFAARIVWLQLVASLVLVSDMSGKLEDLQTGLADKGEDWLREQLASLTLGPLRVIAGELGLSRSGSKAELVAAIGNEMSQIASTFSSNQERYVERSAFEFTNIVRLNSLYLRTQDRLSD